MILTIEELSINAWPALQTLLVDGWVLRFAGGYTRRANSINPLYPIRGDVDELIAACEAHYHRLGLPVTFKMTPESTPADLDERLAARGYRFDAHTSVQTLDLRGWDGAIPSDVELSPDETEDWQTSFETMHHLEGKSTASHRQILGLILPQTGFAALRVDGAVAACGLGVLQDGYLGLFDIITAEPYRRRGLSERLIGGLLAWAKSQGAHSAYLQVMLNNPPALALYAKLGFREAYRYWYRVL